MNPHLHIPITTPATRELVTRNFYRWEMKGKIHITCRQDEQTGLWAVTLTEFNGNDVPVHQLSSRPFYSEPPARWLTLAVRDVVTIRLGGQAPESTPPGFREWAESLVDHFFNTSPNAVSTGHTITIEETAPDE